MVTKTKIGHWIVCPDCEVLNRVVKPTKSEKTFRAPDVSDVHLSEVEPVIGEPVRQWAKQIMIDAEEKVRQEEESLPELPKRPFVNGIYSFPIYSSVIPRLVGLSILLSIVLLLAVVALPMVTPLSVQTMLGLVLLVIMTLFLAAWALNTSGHLFAIIKDTAAGLDEIESWPEGFFVDRIPETFYFFNAAAFSAIPAALLGTILRFVHLPEFPVQLLAIVLFPICLLSMFAADTCMAPYHAAVWKSLRQSKRIWFIFYAHSFSLLLLMFVVCLVLTFLGDILPYVVIGFLTMVTLFLYARLLGRLALSLPNLQQQVDRLDEVETEEFDAANVA